MISVSIVLPCYNEADNIVPLVIGGNAAYEHHNKK